MAWVDITKGVNLLNAMRDGWAYFTEVSENREDPYVFVVSYNTDECMCRMANCRCDFLRIRAEHQARVSVACYIP